MLEYLRQLVRRVSKSAFIRPILRPIRVAHRRNKFRKTGIENLRLFDECITTLGLPYTLAFGTMLGAVREHGFIKYDQDIDVAMWVEDYTPKLRSCLEKKGFTLFHKLTVDGGNCGLEETFVRDGVRIDVFYIYPAIDQYPYYCDFVGFDGTISFDENMEIYGGILPRRIQLPWKKEFQRVSFERLKLPITTNAEEILSFRYGTDYMTPNPNWNYTCVNDYTYIWKEKKGIVEHK